MRNNTDTVEVGETTESYQPATMPGTFDRDLAYEEWVDDCERNAAADRDLEAERLDLMERQ
jgi:hypothetical protein